MAHDPEKARARRKRYLERQKVEKYGEGAAGVDMRGRHGNHARGADNGRWNDGRLRTGHGYIIVRVDPAHPRAFGPPGLKRFKYAYEHDLVMEAKLGRPLTREEIVHHVNGTRDDNRPENLDLETRSDHAREHADAPGARDDLGRFAPGPDGTRVRHPPGSAR